MADKKFPVTELFLSVQGEGALTGLPSFFIRFFGCRYQCNWCFGAPPGRRKPHIITTNGKNKKIMDIKIGDTLLTFDEKTNDMVETTVIDTMRREVDQWLRITIAGTQYFVTEEHPFFTNRGMVEAQDLILGDMILHASSLDKISWSKRGDSKEVPKNNLEVQAIKLFKRSDFPPSIRPKPLLVYNISCAPHNSYLVDYMWVHNCDSLHSVLPEQKPKDTRLLTAVEIIKQIDKQKNANYAVTLTGGDPCLWDLGPLVMELELKGHQVNIETQGSIYTDWLDAASLVTVSPKGPSSGMLDRLYIPTLTKLMNLRTKSIMKIVIMNNDDLDFAEKLHVLFPHKQMYLTVGTIPQKSEKITKNKILENYDTLIQQVLKRPKLCDVIVSPQMHVLAWGTKKGV